MSHLKAIESGKEHRREYRKSKRFDSTCRNHGGCNYCFRNRTVGFQKLLAREKLEELLLKGDEG